MPEIRELRESDLQAVLDFTDRQIGDNYFSEVKMQMIIKASQKSGVMCSFVLEDSGRIEGIRLTYPPGQWLERALGQEPHPELWDVKLGEAAYFQSLFISEKFQAQGFGKRLSLASIENLKKIGAKAVICHSWDESPGNSSRRYLEALGFQPVTSIPKFWKEVKYECTRDGYPCECTATEMVVYL